MKKVLRVLMSGFANVIVSIAAIFFLVPVIVFVLTRRAWRKAELILFYDNDEEKRDKDEYKDT